MRQRFLYVVGMITGQKTGDADKDPLLYQVHSVIDGCAGPTRYKGWDRKEAFAVRDRLNEEAGY